MKDVLGLRLDFASPRNLRVLSFIAGPIVALLALSAGFVVSLLHTREQAEADISALQSKLRERGPAHEAPDTDAAKQRAAADAMSRALTFDWPAEFVVLEAATTSAKVTVLNWKVNQTTGEREMTVATETTADAVAAIAEMKKAAAGPAAQFTKITSKQASGTMPVRAVLTNSSK